MPDFKNINRQASVYTRADGHVQLMMDQIVNWYIKTNQVLTPKIWASNDERDFIFVRDYYSALEKIIDIGIWYPEHFRNAVQLELDRINTEIVWKENITPLWEVLP